MSVMQILAQMSIGEWLGWATTFIDQLGLTDYIRAFFVISAALGFLGFFLSRRGD